ncbi:MAG TPA: phytoene/squalene synthase family protein, partial [Candidatus Sulfotelmatobacter sp.]
MSASVQPAPVPWTPAPAQLVMAYSVCRGITRTAAKNFYYAFLVLPRRKRQALCAVYSFMRRCDDLADDPSLSIPERRQKLEAWLDALHCAQQGQPTDDPILLALTDAQRRHRIPAGLLDELAHGTAMDVVDAPATHDGEAAPALAIQYQTFEDLRAYCYRVASVVGLVCIHVFGYKNPEAEPLAETCGLAFQLTNIIRDVKEDAALGRVYLPEEDLSKFGLT